MRHLYILRSGEYIPILLSLPPTSIRPFSDFMNVSFVSRRRPVWSSIVEIGLKRVDNGSNTYSVATFKKLHDFSGEELAQIKQYADSFREQIKMMLHQRAADTETRSEASEMYERDVRYSTIENDGHFSISGSNVIDGERNALPA